MGVDARLHFSSPKPLAAYFAVPIDMTPWNGGYGSGAKPKPERGRAPFRWQDALDAQGKPKLPHSYGIYVLAFRVPGPAIYIGIAADGRGHLEGIANRLRKHRVKVTGSHAGAGVEHPRKWRDFATKRRVEIDRSGRPDTLEDAVVMTGAIRDGSNAKDVCEYYENRLIRSLSIQSSDALGKRFVREVFGDGLASFECLNGNKGSSRGRRPEQAGVIFGAGETVWLD